jgi:hypothetical protein
MDAPKARAAQPEHLSGTMTLCQACELEERKPQATFNLRKLWTQQNFAKILLSFPT